LLTRYQQLAHVTVAVYMIFSAKDRILVEELHKFQVVAWKSYSWISWWLCISGWNYFK